MSESGASRGERPTRSGGRGFPGKNPSARANTLAAYPTVVLISPWMLCAFVRVYAGVRRVEILLPMKFIFIADKKYY
jgi:hypothetical protein